MVAGDADTEHCLRLGRELAGRGKAADRPAGAGRRLGPARLSRHRATWTTGRRRSTPVIEAALRDGDPAGLAALDAGLAAELLVAGRAAWQVLAGATEGRTFRATLSYSADPFGVWYPVSSWYPS